MDDKQYVLLGMVNLNTAAYSVLGGEEGFEVIYACMLDECGQYIMIYK